MKNKESQIDLRYKPRCNKCGYILKGIGDVYYCSNRKCKFSRPKTNNERDYIN